MKTKTNTPVKAPAPIPSSKQTPAARVLAQEAGLTTEQVAKRARMTPAHFGVLARNGGAPWRTAERLSNILGCSPAVFLWGLRRYHESLGAGGAATPAPTAEQYPVAANHRLRRGQRPTLRKV